MWGISVSARVGRVAHIEPHHQNRLPHLRVSFIVDKVGIRARREPLSFQTQKLVFAFLAQKLHVKSQSDLTPSPTSTSVKENSRTQTVILKIEPQ